MLLVKNKEDTLFAWQCHGMAVKFSDSTELDSNTVLNGNMPFTFVWDPN
jgi:hypothetical protein